jgi:hypothetical protein
MRSLHRGGPEIAALVANKGHRELMRPQGVAAPMVRAV